MAAYCFHDTVRRVKETDTNELTGHGLFVERAISDWIHGDIDDVLTRIIFLFKFKDFNGNEVQ